MIGASRRYIGEGNCCSDLGKLDCQFITGESNMTRNSLEDLSYTREMESARAQISQKDCEERGTVKRRAKADSVKRAD